VEKIEKRRANCCVKALMTKKAMFPVTARTRATKPSSTLRRIKAKEREMETTTLPKYAITIHVPMMLLRVLTSTCISLKKRRRLSRPIGDGADVSANNLIGVV